MTIGTLQMRDISAGPDAQLIELVAKIKEIADQINTTAAQAIANGAAITTINSKLSGLSDPVTITISTITVDAINTAFATVETQQKTTIAALKA